MVSSDDDASKDVGSKNVSDEEGSEIENESDTKKRKNVWNEKDKDHKLIKISEGA